MDRIVMSLRQFVKEIGIPMDVRNRFIKLREEYEEMTRAHYEYLFNQTTKNKKAYEHELADLAMVSILALDALHVDPCAAIMEKLDATFEKYRQRAGEGK